MIDDAWNNMGKSVKMDAKAAEHERKVKYWEDRANTINLSIPRSIEFYKYKLELAKKAVNKVQKNYNLAVR